jgi:hypothetical protein
MAVNEVYGQGGYDSGHPNGNVVERTVDNLDGTGTRTTYTPEGEVESVEQLTGLPVPPLPTDDLLTAVDPRDTTTIRRT